MKKKLKVTFIGEPGVDMGGLTKEWFMLLVRNVFRAEYGKQYAMVMEPGDGFHATKAGSIKCASSLWQVQLARRI